MIFDKREDEELPLLVIRWVARIMSLAILFLLGLFAFGQDGVTSGAGIRGHEYVGFLFFPVGVAIGFLIGWKNELLGGLTSVASLTCFYLVYELAVLGQMPRGRWFVLFTLPGFLFLAYGLLRLRLVHGHGAGRTTV